MSVWLGGLVVLLLAALGGGFSGGLRRALATFSRVAFWCVVVLVLTRRVRVVAPGRVHDPRATPTRATATSCWSSSRSSSRSSASPPISRSIVRKRRSAPLDAPDSAIAAIDERTVAGLRTSVAGEVVLGLAVLAVTALLVNAQPARSALAPKLFSANGRAPAPAQAR